MVITKLTASKRVPGRFYVDFDDGATLRVPELVVSEYALYPERELDAAEYESVRAESETGLARQRALRVLGSRVMSRGEMEARLIKLGETEETAAETAEWLSDIGLIDDLEYARAIARGYSRRGYGSRRVRDELYKRRIPRGMWDEALAEVPEDDAPETAVALIEKKLNGAAPSRDDRRRVAAFLARRGFAWDEINAALSKYADRAANPEEDLAPFDDFEEPHE